MASTGINTLKVLTGSATNTLGTLGRSIFNSTVGLYADADSMNQIYGAINKLTNLAETTEKTIDVEAVSGRNKADDLFSILVGLDIKHSYEFMNKNTEFMKRLMRLNKQEKDITLNALGVDVSGKSNTITNEYLKNYDYVQDNNYLENYVNTLQQNQQIGDETTILRLESSNHFNYSGNHNELYTVSENLYPDDEGKGTFANKWIVENQNSLMYKTKKLFNSKKIGTIISRFHTDQNRTSSPLESAKSKYGLSHGRNLLKKNAEVGYSSNYANGYDNPYCRAWTHHHQYDRFYKTMRPFSSVDNQGNYSDTLTLDNFHKWTQFSDDNDTNGQTQGKWGWKKGSNEGWKNSVLQDNGMVNITPKYKGGGEHNIHTKQCMFAIENLAWRGYDPYSFEQALSWEQRGPLGGRIMWFPPYGIQFQETTQANWQSNTFLGRGEDVYTYANTTRSGTLSFKMIVDHPSIIDYVTWTDSNQNVTDTDILRYFAGCNEMGNDALRMYAKPTPLTDEYTQTHDKKEEENSQFDDNGDSSTSDSEKTTEKKISFYVFYPNNYSGTWDDKQGEGYTIDSTSQVDPILYLLFGKGAQKKLKDKKIVDLELNENNLKNSGNGYEMTNAGITDTTTTTNSIKGLMNNDGTSPFKNDVSKNIFWGGSISTNVSDIINDPIYWHYRIDGREKFTNASNEKYINYYNQYLGTLNYTEYTDNQSSQLNKNIESNHYVTDSDKDTSFTLAEMAYVLYNNNNNIKTKIYSDENDRIKKLQNILKGKVTKVQGFGYYSDKGYKELNETLGKNRFLTAAHWFLNKVNASNITPQIINIPENLNVDTHTQSDKARRFARVDIIIQTNQTESDISANTEETNNTSANAGETKSVEYNYTGRSGYCSSVNKYCKIYQDKNGKKYYKTSEDNANTNKYISVEYDLENGHTPKLRYGENNGSDENRLRYDQEYHFFKVLEQKDPLVFSSLMKKLQYFDPAFHSMTPEGFNGRLTFLQQCMRQGNTVSASDGKFEKSANNLAFGRAPYCVLRLGDFYNQMIVIDNLSINYDPLVWDLNTEGIGVQPLIANVQLSFKFVGGGDLTGPVRRLQNAMSFNYYANARLYDNRADRIERKWSDATCGAIKHDEILDNSENNVYTNGKKVSQFYTTQMYK